MSAQAGARTSASDATPDDNRRRTLVWDLPLRVFHWTLALSFLGAYFTAESERWRDLHVILGYTAGVLIVFRLAWGVVGTRYARFASFLYRPAAVVAYLRSLLTTRPQHFVGHNPAGALAIFLLLALIVASVLSGWATFVQVGPEWLEDAHETFSNVALAMVVVHLAGVVVSSWLHRENLVGAMVTGYKPVAAPPAAGARTLIAVVLLVIVGAMWSGAVPLPGLTQATGPGLSPPAVGGGHARERRHKDDDD